MPLAAQALLPFLALLGAAAVVQRRPRRKSNGWIAAAATGTARIIAMVELLRLPPGARGGGGRRPLPRLLVWGGCPPTPAACAVIFAHNLLLVYITLQLLTLAWSGALDETARRRRGLRLAVQIADIGLLLAAASAIQSVGTSAFSGVPSDTFGLATFVL